MTRFPGRFSKFQQLYGIYEISWKKTFERQNGEASSNVHRESRRVPATPTRCVRRSSGHGATAPEAATPADGVCTRAGLHCTAGLHNTEGLHITASKGAKPHGGTAARARAEDAPTRDKHSTGTARGGAGLLGTGGLHCTVSAGGQQPLPETQPHAMGSQVRIGHKVGYSRCRTTSAIVEDTSATRCATGPTSARPRPR